jgi:outer membrane protein OmpA-like peptidoglycan-associated protein
LNGWKILAVGGALIGLEFFGLRACYQTTRPQEDVALASRSDDSVVALRDGSVLIAQQGTIGRDLLDWFNNRRAAPARFDIGRVQFEPESAAPSPQTQVLLQRFGQELRANPEVVAAVLVCTSGDGPDDARLAISRASRIKAELVGQHVNPNHVTIPACGFRSGRPGTATPSEPGGEFIGIELTHGD